MDQASNDPKSIKSISLMQFILLPSIHMKLIHRFLHLAIITYCLLIHSFLIAQPENRGCHLHAYQGVQFPEESAKNRSYAANTRSDTFDVLHYDIFINLVGMSSSSLKGKTTVTLVSKLNNINQLDLDFTTLIIDSLYVDGILTSNFQYLDPLISIPLSKTANQNDTVRVTLVYHGKPKTDPVWGGFYFESGYAYNLGIGLSSNPPNFGRVWYPCFDNFVERATYDFRILTSNGNVGYGVGTLVSEQKLGSDSLLRHYQMNQLLPTYLSHIAATNYTETNYTHTGAFQPIPVQLVSRPADQSDMKTSFSDLGFAIDACEKWYGPYPWERVGYIITTRGAMEHPTSIAYPNTSITNGMKNNRLFSHELTHCWWGDYTTLTSHSDMWIKEGNAEYGSHLMIEHQKGRNAFTDAVKSNTLFVLRNAHYDDGGLYHAMSPMPFPYIYGTTTYYKGALVLHNLRGYLGDSLFTLGQKYVLQSHPYQSITPEQYRDDLIEVTKNSSVDDFFNDWIYQGGFNVFVLDSFSSIVAFIGHIVTVDITQKLHHCPNLHKDVPLDVWCRSKEGTIYKTQIIVNGKHSQVKFNCPFEPVMITLNESAALNQARMDYGIQLTKTGNSQLPYVDLTVNVQALSDTGFIYGEHIWAEPDQPDPGQFKGKISRNHYWIVKSILEPGTKLGGRLPYDRSLSNAELDADLLTGVTEDSLRLLWRPGVGHPWKLHPYYKKAPTNVNDGIGFFIIDSLYMGEYTFGYGDFSTSTGEISNTLPIRITPNPTTGICQLLGLDDISQVKQVRLYSIDGKFLMEPTLNIFAGTVSFDIQSLSPGPYLLHILDKKGLLLRTETIIKQ